MFRLLPLEKLIEYHKNIKIEHIKLYFADACSIDLENKCFFSY